MLTRPVGLALALCAVAACAAPHPRLRSPGPIAEADVDAAVDMAADYLDRHLDESGRFTYRINLAGHMADDRYNVLRHAGAVYALAQYRHIAGSPAVDSMIQRAARHLVSRHLGPVASARGAIAAYSLPGEESRSGAKEAKLGGAGLTLIALVEARETNPDAVSMDTLRGLGQFVLFMQRPSGDFESKLTRDGFSAFRSLYYPGEAILGLARLHEIDPDPAWLEAGLRAIDYLLQSRRGQGSPPPDHWLLIAAARLIETGRLTGDARDAAVRHMVEIAQAMLAEQAQQDGGHLVGAFDGLGRSTPTATRLEGLLALLRVLPREHPQRQPLRAAVTRGTHFLLRCQVIAGPGRGGFVRALAPVHPAPDSSFNRRQSEVRIDYVQHAMSALIGYRELVEDSR